MYSIAGRFATQAAGLWRAPAESPKMLAAAAFLYGASFFYERIPASHWQRDLLSYRSLGINTIDLYVMWNWHEPQPGVYDFTGRTNPRRNLAGLLRMVARDGFRIVLRPGPVIRNEWRNGGYPAWLLERPAYDMPLRDVLEGRYPATATLQNRHSDAAAAQWMHNAVHMTYATQWIRRVLAIAAPYRQRIAGVALDDDQGAYLDNDTWPAPHFHRYVEYLASLVRSVYGASVPVFINTYEMKVTASTPVWAWGDWYQSDAYRIGEHDRKQLEFSTGLLGTQAPARPIVIGEFQAGWLQGADEAWPRAADPSNTTLALHTLLQMGVHGVINFPVQDTFYPAGWEVPWADAFYSWDAALSVEDTPQARFAPVKRFGELIARYGALLAQTHPAADAAVAYLTSAYDPAHLTNAGVASIADATMSAQQGCRVVRITCALVDLRYDAPRLPQYRVLIVPATGVRMPFTAAIARTIAAYRRGGGRIVASARDARVAHPAAGGIPNAVLLISNDRRFGFLDVVNYGRTPLRTSRAQLRFGRFFARIAPLVVPARDALLLPVGVSAPVVPLPPLAPPAPPANRLPLRLESWVTMGAPDDAFDDGYPTAVFSNSHLRLVISACAGGRAFLFEDMAHGDNLFTTVGGLRDAWTPRLRPSPRDYIAKYTHPITAGTFNRCYAMRRSGSSVTLTYTAPDAPPHGVTFAKTIALDGAGNGFTETISAHFPQGRRERAQQLTSFALPPHARVRSLANGYAIDEPDQRRIVMVTWRGGVVARSLAVHPRSALLTLTFAPGTPRHIHFVTLRLSKR
jgi:hypothetical protein